MSAGPDPAVPDPAASGPAASDREAPKGRAQRSSRRLIHRAWRDLVDPDGWRTAGTEEYAFTIEAVRFLRVERALRVTVGLLAMSMMPLATVMQFHPMGPHGVPARLINAVAAASGIVLGLRWLAGRWPSAREATGFLFVADLMIGVGTSVLSDPAARICGSIHLAMLGMFAAFFLGWRILLLHCTYALVLIVALMVYAVAVDGYTPMDLYVYAAPAISTVVGLPIAVQVIVETGRRGLTRIAREWYIDALTGVYNRRGTELAMRRAARHVADDDVLIVGMLDLDGFKLYNDGHGHAAGDGLLVDVAARLHRLPRVIAGRYGGDEFVVFARRDDVADAERTLRDLRDLVCERGVDDVRIRGSLGIAVARGRDRARLSDLAQQADVALYEAKRSATASVVVRDPAVPRPDGDRGRAGRVSGVTARETEARSGPSDR